MLSFRGAQRRNTGGISVQAHPFEAGMTMSSASTTAIAEAVARQLPPMPSSSSPYRRHRHEVRDRASRTAGRPTPLGWRARPSFAPGLLELARYPRGVPPPAPPELHPPLSGDMCREIFAGSTGLCRQKFRTTRVLVGLVVSEELKLWPVLR
jgi:hypothetical protein